MDLLVTELRTALRALRRRPATTAAVVGVLAAGIALNAAVFAVLDGVLLRPLPYPDAGALVRLHERHPERGLERYPVAPAKVDDWRALAASLFRRIAAYRLLEMDLAGGEEPTVEPVALVGEGFLRTLGVTPSLGRGFTVEEIRAGAPVALVAHGFWVDRLGSDPDATGRSVTVAGEPRTVVGVLPPGAVYPEPARILLPLEIPNRSSRAAHGLEVVARLAPGVSVADARRGMASVAARLAREHAETDAGWGVDVEGLREARVGDVGASLLLLQGAVGLVLLLVFANAGTLLLARSLEREGDVQIRRALGAPGIRVAGGIVAESVLLAAAGGVAGALLTPPALDVVLAVAPPDLPYLDRIHVAPLWLAGAVALSVALGLATGLLQAASALRRDPGRGLARADRRSGGSQRSWHRLLVVGQAALATVLLVTAGLLWRSVRALDAVDTGIRAAGVATARLTPPRHRYPSARERLDLYERLLEESGAAFPEAGLVSHLPLSGRDAVFRVRFEGRPPGSFADLETTRIRSVTAGYLRAVGIPVVRGRGFDGRDGPDAPGRVLVNETFARLHWPDEDALGRRVSLEGPDGPWLTVVGVVGDVRHAGPAEPPLPELYRPFRQEPWPSATLVVRADGIGAPLARLRALVHRVDPELPVRELRTLEEVRSAATSRWRFPARLSGAFAAAALLLAAAGTFAVLSVAVRERRREMAIRAALGAGPRAILHRTVVHGLTPVGAGALVGAGAAALASGLLRGLLFGVVPHDPLTFAAAPAVLLGSALLATWIPARRASRVDPVAVLREP